MYKGTGVRAHHSHQIVDENTSNTDVVGLASVAANALGFIESA